MKQNYILAGKTLFFPQKEILVIGDLHLGYEPMLRNEGISFPFNQLKQSEQDIEKIINQIKIQKNKISKIIILGDLKHHFNFNPGEKEEIRNFLEFLEKFAKKENIILLKGNHEKFELDDRKHHNFYIQEELAFLHGDKEFPEIWNKKIKIIIMGHLHPSVILQDKPSIKKEKYKCFLIGKYKRKNIIIVPSFFPLVKGAGLNEGFQNKKDFSIIPTSKLRKFNVHVLGKDKIYGFGKLKNLD